MVGFANTGYNQKIIENRPCLKKRNSRFLMYKHGFFLVLFAIDLFQLLMFLKFNTTKAQNVHMITKINLLDGRVSKTWECFQEL